MSYDVFLIPSGLLVTLCACVRACARVCVFGPCFVMQFIYTIFQKGDIFSSMASLPHITDILKCPYHLDERAD